MTIKNANSMENVHSMERVRSMERVLSTEKNITIMSKRAQENSRVGKEKDRTGKTVFAGELNGDFSLLDRIKQRKESAQEKALKVVSDAWGGDRKIGEIIDRSKDHFSELQGENSEFRAEINELTRQSDDLMTEYQVEPGSEEQQELELLKKEEASRHRRLSGVELSEEEKEHLARIHEKEPTEYQSRALELEKRIWEDRQEIYYNEKGITGMEMENAIIRGVREEQRKVHPVLDAQKQAEEIMESARDEIVNMAVNDAKDHLEEAQEKREEEAAEIKEEKEKQEEILEKRKDKEEELEELMEEMPIDQMANAAQTLSEVKRQIQNIVNEMNLVVEDIKGAQVDASL